MRVNVFSHLLLQTPMRIIVVGTLSPSQPERVRERNVSHFCCRCVMPKTSDVRTKMETLVQGYQVCSQQAENRVYKSRSKSLFLHGPRFSAINRPLVSYKWHDGRVPVRPRITPDFRIAGVSGGVGAHALRRRVPKILKENPKIYQIN